MTPAEAVEIEDEIMSKIIKDVNVQIAALISELVKRGAPEVPKHMQKKVETRHKVDFIIAYLQANPEVVDTIICDTPNDSSGGYLH